MEHSSHIVPCFRSSEADKELPAKPFLFGTPGSVRFKCQQAIVPAVRLNRWPPFLARWTSPSASDYVYRTGNVSEISWRDHSWLL